MDVTGVLADFVVTTSYEDLGDRLVRLVARQIADTIGVAIAGAASPPATIARSLVSRAAGERDATVWGTAARGSMIDAAFANGIASHALDFDDTWVLGGHPSAPTLPATLAAAEAHDVDGRTLVVAQAIAYEVHARLAAGVPSRGGWHPTGALGIYGAVAGAGRILGLDREQLRAAFGLAASHAGGIDGHEGTMTKPFHAGHAARGGVAAALLASSGFTANRNVFEGRHSVLRTFYRGMDLTTWPLTSGLGRSFLVEHVGIGVKLYPAGYYLHQGFEAALRLVNDHGVTTDRIERVRIAFPPNSRFNRPVLTSHTEGKFSLQFVVAAAILDQALTIDSFGEAAASRSEVADLMSRTEAVIDPDLTDHPDLRHNPVTILTYDGRSFTTTEPVPRSHWDHPLADADWQRKFLDNTERGGLARGPDVLDRLADLEHETSVRSLCRSLAVDDAPRA